MLNNLKKSFNETTTTNGDKAYKSTNSHVLDLFSKGGAVRYHGEDTHKSLVSKALAEDVQLTLRTLFYLRDVRGGQGERAIFRNGVKEIARTNPDSLRKNLKLFSEYGRFDDLLVLLDTSLVDDVIEVISNQLNEDLISSSKGENVSLLAKWLPSENASSKKTKELAKIVRKGLKMSPKEYRKTLSSLRKEIDILETKITEKKYDEVEYDKIPSVAGMKYRQAFFRNDFERYDEFLSSLSKGEKKINAATLYPYDIVSKIMGQSFFHYQTKEVGDAETKLYQGMWDNLPNFLDGEEDSLVMADVSGSMYGQPINVSISLAMYIAERNKGAFHNHFMTFSSSPELVEIVGNDIVSKVQNISNADWGYNTNLESALLKVLDVAVKDNLPQSELPKKFYIISDMQFDQATVFGESVKNSVKKKYELAGYEMPVIVFWNVNGSSTSPATQNEQGVVLVSGLSPSIMKFAMNCEKFTPYDFMLEVINSERYQAITA